tara:strand:+ start:2464 stop:2676 length:213 start_codon:yes stop_codon:yes gene_type:complete
MKLEKKWKVVKNNFKKVITKYLIIIMDVRLIMKDLDDIIVSLKEIIVKYETENKALKIKINEMKKYIKNK